MTTGRGKIRRGEVWLVKLDPTIGSEIRKTRPAIVVSPDEMNDHLRSFIICPLTSTLKGWPSRVAVVFEGRNGEVAVDQVRAADRTRFTKKLGILSDLEHREVQDRLVHLFSM